MTTLARPRSRRSSAVAHTSRARLTSRSSRRRPSTAIRRRVPPVRPTCCAGTARGARALQQLAERGLGAPTRSTREADSLNSVAAGSSHCCGRRAAGRLTSAPIDCRSPKAHSASVTATPPSEQSCAEREQAVGGRAHEQDLQRSLGADIERGRQARVRP